MRLHKTSHLCLCLAKANPIDILDGKKVHAGMQHGLFTAWPDFNPAFGKFRAALEDRQELENACRYYLG